MPSDIQGLHHTAYRCKDVEETQMKELKRWQQRQKWRQWTKMEEEQVQRRLELGPEFLILES